LKEIKELEDLWLKEDKQFELEINRLDRLKLENAQDELYEKEKWELLAWKVEEMKEIAGDDLRESDIEYQYEDELEEIEYERSLQTWERQLGAESRKT